VRLFLHRGAGELGGNWECHAHLSFCIDSALNRYSSTFYWIDQVELENAVRARKRRPYPDGVSTVPVKVYSRSASR
jgi:hypothetical protein